MVNKRLINTGVEAAPAAFDPLQNFETVTYTGNGGTQKITGYIRKGAAFNGTTSSYIDYATLEPFFQQKQTFTLSLWFYTSSTNSGGGTLFADYAVNSFNILAYIQNSNIVVETRYSSAGTSYTSSATYLNAWTHLVVTLDQSTGERKVYINGNLEDTQTVSANSYTSNYSDNRVQLGSLFNDANNTQNNPYNGKIDQVRIFNTALNETQVGELALETYADPKKSTTDYFGDGHGIALYELDEDAKDTGDTYNGTPTNVNFLGMAFQPDLVWIKNRDAAVNHKLLDSIRFDGTNYEVLESNTTGAAAATTQFSSFDSNGFTLGGGASAYNGSGTDYVAWCWKAGGTVSADNNSNGDITSTVSANPDAGFSIVKYTGDRSSGTNQTIGHGLSSAPELIIAKRLTGAVTATNGYWAVYSSGLTSASYYLKLNETAAEFNDSAIWGGTTPTTDVFTVRDGAANNSTNEDHIAYCFHSVDGYQKVGSYLGDSSTGNKVYTDSNSDGTGTGGFQPRFVMIKSTGANSGGWIIYDVVRDTDGELNKYLFANSDANEGTAASAFIKPVSDGFEVNSASEHINQSGYTYIYLAIA